jgi:Putative bacterial sensory transduction regulator
MTVIKTGLLSACLIGVFCTVPAAAQTEAPAAEPSAELVPGFSLKEVQTLLVDEGYRAKIESDASGEYIRSGVGGISLFVSLLDCAEDGTSCLTIRLETGSFTPDPAVSLEALNEWNRTVGYGWVVPVVNEDGSHYLVTQLSTTGGVTKPWLANYMALFGDKMNRYHQLLFP